MKNKYFIVLLISTIVTILGAAFFIHWDITIKSQSPAILEKQIEKKTRKLLQQTLNSNRFDILVSIQTAAYRQDFETFVNKPDKVKLKSDKSVSKTSRYHQERPETEKQDQSVGKLSPGFSTVLDHTRKIEWSEKIEQSSKENLDKTVQYERQYDQLVLNHNKESKTIHKSVIDQIILYIMVDSSVLAQSGFQIIDVRNRVEQLFNLDVKLNVIIEETVISVPYLFYSIMAILGLGIFLFLIYFFRKKTQTSRASTEKEESLFKKPLSQFSQDVNQDVHNELTQLASQDPDMFSDALLGLLKQDDIVEEGRA